MRVFAVDARHGRSPRSVTTRYPPGAVRRWFAALNENMRTAGRSWAYEIHRPGAFIAYRLRDLPKRPPQVPAAPRRDDVEDNKPVAPPAAAGGRRAAMEYFARCRTGRRKGQLSGLIRHDRVASRRPIVSNQHFWPLKKRRPESLSKRFSWS